MLPTQERHDLLAIFAHAPVAVALLREPDHQLDYWNDLFTEFFPGARVGVTVAEALPTLATQQVLAHLDRLYQNGESYKGAAERLPGPGAPRYVTFTYQAYREQGRVAGVALFIQDVTAQELARQQAEQVNQQLAEQQTHLYQILGQMPAAIAVLSGPAHRFTFFNAQYQRLSGGRSVLGATLAEVLPDATAQEFSTLLDQVYQTGEAYRGSEVPIRLPHPEGEPDTYYVDFRCQPLPDAQGQVQGILVFAVEVTSQVLARRQTAALQAELLAAAQAQVLARETFYQVFAQTPAAICVQRGPAHHYEYVNAAYQRYFPGRELVGHAVAQAVPETVDNGLLALLDQVYQTGETYYGYEVPVLLTQPDGSTTTQYVTFTYQAYRENGEIVGICTFAYDVAELVLSRREREAQQQLVSTVFEQAPAGIWVVRGPEYIFEVINPVMTQILGRTPQQALGRPYFEVLPELVDQGLPELLRQVWEQGQPMFVEELPAQLAYHTPEETGYFTFVFQPLRNEAGQVTRISCVALDVTPQVQARRQVQVLNQELTAINQELSTSNHQLTRTNADLDTFIYTASHDLRAPIANIEGLVNALRTELNELLPANADIDQFLRLMSNAIARFQTTIGHLTDIMQLQHAGPQSPERSELAPILEGVRLDLAGSLEASHAQLLVDIAACPTLALSAKDLRSVLYNLLSNALKYRDPARSPVVQVTAQQDAHGVALCVQDNGLGLSEAQQAKLFGLFQRLHSHVEGSGVGLYSIRKLVENAGGTIRVESAPGVGSTFTVRIPAPTDTLAVT